MISKALCFPHDVLKLDSVYLVCNIYFEHLFTLYYVQLQNYFITSLIFIYIFFRFEESSAGEVCGWSSPDGPDEELPQPRPGRPDGENLANYELLDSL